MVFDDFLCTFQNTTLHVLEFSENLKSFWNTVIQENVFRARYHLRSIALLNMEIHEGFMKLDRPNLFVKMVSEVLRPRPLKQSQSRT